MKLGNSATKSPKWQATLDSSRALASVLLLLARSMPKPR
jgi:hypothetical protein